MYSHRYRQKNTLSFPCVWKFQKPGLISPPWIIFLVTWWEKPIYKLVKPELFFWTFPSPWLKTHICTIVFLCCDFSLWMLSQSVTGFFKNLTLLSFHENLELICPVILLILSSSPERWLLSSGIVFWLVGFYCLY